MDAGEIGQQSSFPTIFQWHQYSAPASSQTRLQDFSDSQDSPSSVGNQDSSPRKKGKYKSYSLEMKSPVVSSNQVIEIHREAIYNSENIQSCGTIVNTKVNCFCYQQKIWREGTVTLAFPEADIFIQN
eukprot:TRINITY_DN111_c0_g1_i8.p1 TRINITY_DN111_c0_g1~~TRINITY_DN111_c0_g1_i8.p1  ORF type:complete len:128 (+),score=27.55 TRINITY_DN111_c0_g1_i8:1114-1497(+)